MVATGWTDDGFGGVPSFVSGSGGSLAEACFEVAARSASLVSGGGFQYKGYRGGCQTAIYKSRKGLC